MSSYIEACPNAGRARQPKALIVPHAGYLYSGAVAGCAYRVLRDCGASIRHVVLVGPSHRVPMRGLAVTSLDYFATPLGQVPIDGFGRQRLRELGLVGIADAPHATEHSLEVQLPFLQVVLGEFDLLPIAAGHTPPDLVARTLEAAWKVDQGTATDADMAMAKLKATEVLAMVADEALQIHGGMGLMADLPLERIWRDARVERIWEGTSEIQRHIISRALLRPFGA